MTKDWSRQYFIFTSPFFLYQLLATFLSFLRGVNWYQLIMLKVLAFPGISIFYWGALKGWLYFKNQRKVLFEYMMDSLFLSITHQLYNLGVISAIPLYSSNPESMYREHFYLRLYQQMHWDNVLKTNMEFKK